MQQLIDSSIETMDRYMFSESAGLLCRVLSESLYEIVNGEWYGRRDGDTFTGGYKSNRPFQEDNGLGGSIPSLLVAGMAERLVLQEVDMRVLEVAADGGKDSGVKAYFLFEIKWLCSIAILRFSAGSREAYHSHAFNALTWWLKGSATEFHIDGKTLCWNPSWVPKITKRTCFHKIIANETTWAFTIRGPWCKTWQEYSNNNVLVTLTNGREIVKREVK